MSHVLICLAVLVNYPLLGTSSNSRLRQRVNPRTNDWRLRA